MSKEKLNKNDKRKWKVSDLFVDSENGTLSTSKLWFFIGGLVTTLVFVGDAIHNGGTTDAKFAAYGGTGGLTAMASKFISKRARGRHDRFDDDC